MVTKYRALAASCNYLSMAGPDIQYAVKELCRDMSKPLKGSWHKLQRVGQYLRGRPRLVWRFEWQDPMNSIDVYADANWAGCTRTRKSSSGGCTLIGQHCVKAWSKTQAIIAKSRAEAELYGVASCEALGTLTLMEELGSESTARVHVDASAAKGIIERRGLDKVRHIDVNVLWLQEQEIRGKVPLRKVDGTKNPADLMTKHLDAKKAEGHLERLGMKFRDGRVQAAANLYSVEHGSEIALKGSSAPGKDETSKTKKTKVRWEDMGDEEEELDDKAQTEYDFDDEATSRRNSIRGGAFRGGATAPDRWTCRGQGLTWIREHRTPRTSMFSPDEATRGPSQVGELWSIRTTEGRMQDGRKFIVTDDWTEANEEAGTCLRQP